MFGRWLWRKRLIDAGEQARREHSAFLTRALMLPPNALPRIPTRKVSEGGFSREMAAPEGRRWAQRWWSTTFDRVDEG
jgi:hypothetical protein